MQELTLNIHDLTLLTASFGKLETQFDLQSALQL